jgi:predicted Zn-dependent protease with MMP-like domain
MSPHLRQYFDEQLEQVLPQLPRRVHELLDEVPLYVEDYPSQEVMRKMHVRHRRNLCGLYTGIPLTSRSIEHSGVLSDVIHIYREGILSMATDHRGQIDEEELRKQIRITILHELGHHHGMDEDELEELGY